MKIILQCVVIQFKQQFSPVRETLALLYTSVEEHSVVAFPLLYLPLTAGIVADVVNVAEAGAVGVGGVLSGH